MINTANQVPRGRIFTTCGVALCGSSRCRNCVKFRPPPTESKHLNSSSSSSSSWSGKPVNEHGCFHDTPPCGMIGCTPTCCMEAEVEWLEIRFDWRGWPLGRCQSSGRRLMEARSACARSWAGSARFCNIWSNSFRRRDFTREVTGGWPVLEQTACLVTCAMNLMCRIYRRHHWSKPSTRCLDATVILHVSAP